jgi:hypothetical protein
MSEGRRMKKRLWRWRNNPLRRHDDIVEAWIVLVVWAVIALGGALVGLVTAHAADEVFAGQRADRHSVRAVLLTDVPSPAATIGGVRERIVAKVRWTAPDGTRRTGSTLVRTGLDAGSGVVVWLNGKGDLTTQPPSPTEASLEAALLGLAAALAFTGAAYGAGGVVRWRLEQRRVDSWGREWDLVGPQWGHKTG